MPAIPKSRSVGQPWAWAAGCLLAGLLSACGVDTPSPEARQEMPDAPARSRAIDQAQEPTARADRPEAPAAPLPPTRALEVTVEGQTESREATLFESPQAYAIYVLPQLTMTPEEPCCDIAWARADDGFTLRIERIDPGQELAVLRENMALALSAVGEAQELPREEIGADGVRDAELAMRARSDDASRYMLVARVDGGRYRVTLHLPHREAIEGIAPSMWAMLDSLRTTGPRPPV